MFMGDRERNKERINERMKERKKEEKEKKKERTNCFPIYVVVQKEKK